MSFLTTEWDLDEYLAVQREEAKLEGILEGAVTHATLMLQEGIEPETVTRCTGLTLERVYELKSQL